MDSQNALDDPQMLAEQSVLGGLLLAPERAAEAFERVTAADFSVPAYAEIFRAMHAVHAEGKPVDPVLVVNRLRACGMLDQIGGAEAVVTLTDIVPTGHNLGYYAEIVAAEGRRRGVLRLLDQTRQRVAGGDADAALVTLRREIDRVESAGIGEEYPLLGDPLEEGEGEPFSLGGLFPTLEAFLNGGPRRKKVYVIAGRAGSGKTTALINLIAALKLDTDQKKWPRILFIEQEMTRKETRDRMISLLAQVKFAAVEHITAGDAHEGTVQMYGEKVREIAERISRLPVRFVESASLTPEHYRRLCGRMWKWPDGSTALADVVMLDHMQLSAKSNVADSEYAKLSELTGIIKSCAKNYNHAAFPLSQLNRDNRDENKRPQLSDLRGSGTIEQDADAVIFLHRLANENDGALAKVEIIFGKNRSGPVGFFPVEINFELNRFFDDGSAVRGKGY